jgi:hypothetical protein
MWRCMSIDGVPHSSQGAAMNGARELLFNPTSNDEAV